MITVDPLTPTEAAVVASVPVRDVNRVFDENILPKALFIDQPGRTRRIVPEACVLISFYFKAAPKLSAELRAKTMEIALDKVRRDPVWNYLEDAAKQDSSRKPSFIIHEDFLSIDFSSFLKDVYERLSKLIIVRERVVKDPEILGGTPILKGTRIPVYDVAASVTAGITIERIQKSYPTLTAKDIQLAALYAEAYPRRGRPKRLPEPPPGSVIIRAHRAPRQRG